MSICSFVVSTWVVRQGRCVRVGIDVGGIHFAQARSKGLTLPLRLCESLSEGLYRGECVCVCSCEPRALLSRVREHARECGNMLCGDASLCAHALDLPQKGVFVRDQFGDGAEGVVDVRVRAGAV